MYKLILKYIKKFLLLVIDSHMLYFDVSPTAAVVSTGAVRNPCTPSKATDCSEQGFSGVVCS